MTLNNFKQIFLGKNRFWLKSRYFAIGKWIALLAMLYLAIRFVDLPDVVANFTQIPLSTHISFFILILLSKFLYAFRWHLICVNSLGFRNVSETFLIRTNLLGEFAGIAMLSSLGAEAVRVIKLSARTGVPDRSAVSVAADRLIGLVSVGLIAVALLPKLGASIAGPLPLPVNRLLIVTALSVCGFVLTLFLLYKRNIQSSLPQAIQQLNLKLSFSIILVLISMLGHLLFAIGYYLLFQKIHPIPFLVATALIFTAQLARVVPISLLGIGLGEASIVALASLVGIRPEETIVVVVVALGALYFFAICGLLLELLYDGKVFLNTVIGRMRKGLKVSQ